MITLVVDAMGGDQGLAVTVPGATAFLQAHPDVRLIMTGDETQLRQALNAAGAPMERIDICHTTQVVGMDESPQSALKNKNTPPCALPSTKLKKAKPKPPYPQATRARSWQPHVSSSRPYPASNAPPSPNSFLPTPTTLPSPSTSAQTSTAHPNSLPNLPSSAANSSTHSILKRTAARRAGQRRHRRHQRYGYRQTNLQTAAKQQTQLYRQHRKQRHPVRRSRCRRRRRLCRQRHAQNHRRRSQIHERAIRREFQSNLFNKLAAVAALPALKGLKNKLDPRKFNGTILLGLRGIVIKSHGGTDKTGFRYALEEAYHEAKSASTFQNRTRRCRTTRRTGSRPKRNRRQSVTRTMPSERPRPFRRHPAPVQTCGRGRRCACPALPKYFPVK